MIVILSSVTELSRHIPENFVLFLELAVMYKSRKAEGLEQVFLLFYEDVVRIIIVF